MQAKFLGSLVLSLVVAILAMQNPQSVELSFLFREYTVSLSNLLIGAALLGCFISFGLGVFKDKRHKKAIRLKNREIANLKKEIANVSSANFMKNTDNETAMNYIKESLGITNNTVVETELTKVDEEKNEPVKIKVVTKPKERIKIFDDPIKPIEKTSTVKKTEQDSLKSDVKFEFKPEKVQKKTEHKIPDLEELGIKPLKPSYAKSGLPPELEEFKKSLSINKKFVFPEYPGTKNTSISEKSPDYSETLKAVGSKTEDLLSANSKTEDLFAAKSEGLFSVKPDTDQILNKNVKLDDFPKDNQTEGGFLKDLSYDFSSQLSTSNDLYSSPSALEGRNIMSKELIQKQFNWDSNSHIRTTIEDALKESNRACLNDERLEKKGFFKSVLKPKLDGLFGEIMDD